MRFLNSRPLALLLHILRTLDQKAHGTSFRLALGRHHHRLALLQLPAPAPILNQTLLLAPLPARRPPARTRQTQRHQRGAREHEPDGTAFDPYRKEVLREPVDELEVRIKPKAREVCRAPTYRQISASDKYDLGI
ncbi:hypothetical protein TruAng_012220 [Truncatella angustata]|nr:hypothetical protein TruAng_012220 [Truncatella angustata]